MNRKVIDKVRRELVEAFMAEDEAGFAAAVVKLEDAMGLPHGERISEERLAANSRGGRRAWELRRVQIETEGGITTYSVKL